MFFYTWIKSVLCQRSEDLITFWFNHCFSVFIILSVSVAHDAKHMLLLLFQGFGNSPQETPGSLFPVSCLWALGYESVHM